MIVVDKVVFCCLNPSWRRTTWLRDHCERLSYVAPPTFEA